MKTFGPSPPTARRPRSGSAAPYLDELGPDPWGNEYQYLAEGKKNTEGYDFWSNGPDGQNGSDDDIGNWDNEDK